jgi:hypothetical protein
LLQTYQSTSFFDKKDKVPTEAVDSL